MSLGTSADWPIEATSEPPEYPFSLDRHVYEAPSMEAWRANLHGRLLPGEVDDLDMRIVRYDLGASARPTTDARRDGPPDVRCVRDDRRSTR